MKFRIVNLLVLCCFISGCIPHKIYNKADANIKQAQYKQSKASDDDYPPIVTENSGIYSTEISYDKSKNPAWSRQKVVINEQSETFSHILSRILRKTPAYVEFDQYPDLSIYKSTLQWATFNKFDQGFNVDKTQYVHFVYSGSIKGALEKLAGLTNTYFTIHNNKIVWSRFEVKVFDIPFIPASLDLKNIKNPENPVSSGEKSSIIDKATSLLEKYVPQTKDLSKIKTAKSTENKSFHLGSISLWHDIKQTLTGMISSEGHFDVSEAGTMVVVVDYPANVSKISEFFDKLNHELSRQVRINVQVLEIDLNKDFNYGINWNLVYKFFNSHYHIGLSGDNGSLISNLNGSGSAFSINSTGGTFNTSSMIINALSHQGKLSVITQPTVVALNAQPAKISIKTSQAYLRSVTASQLNPLSSSNTVSYSLTPGDVSTGFELYILPKIIHNKVFLAISSNMSTLNSIEDISSQLVSGESSKKDVNAIIQAPNVSYKDFSQRSIVNSGSTLVLAGFKQLTNQTAAQQFFGSQVLGGKSAQNKNVQTVLLITPVIVGNSG